MRNTVSKLGCCLFVACSAFLTSCELDVKDDVEQAEHIYDWEPSTPTGPLTNLQKDIVNTSSVDMAFSFYSAADKVFDNNFFISPFSMAEALAMLSNGADGETLLEIKTALGLKGCSEQDLNETFQKMNLMLESGNDSASILNVANSLWFDTDYVVKDSFVNVNKSYLDADILTQKLSTEQTRLDINNWASKKTNGCIKDLLKTPLTSEVKMFFMNALYFKAEWMTKFSKGSTYDNEFTCYDKTKSTVKMMSRSGEIKYVESDKFTMAELPYKGERFCMDLILPNQDINTCLKDMNSTSWNKIISSLQPTNLAIFVPKMSLGFDLDMKDVLKSMGVKRAFDHNAEFSRISDSGSRLDFIKQATLINVDEEGTEAAAVTSGGVYISSGVTYKQFCLNRPFIYIIREMNTGAIIFMGKVEKL